MSTELVHAILPPPDLQRFRQLTGTEDAELDVTFDGWSKLAILTADRVFLFPRRGHDADLLHGAMVCESLAELGVHCVPRVLGRWSDGLLSAGPFVAFERRPGTRWPLLENAAGLDEVVRMLRSLGGAIASWHQIAVSALPPEPRRPVCFDRNPWLSGLLDPGRVAHTVDEAVRLLGAEPGRASIWHQTFRELAGMPAVLVHGDVCENQLLVDERQHVHTVLDWDTAGVGHPLYDFDFGEWGVGIFTWEARFPFLREAMWDGYRAGREAADLPSAYEVNLLFTLSELAYLAQHAVDNSLDERDSARLAAYRRAIGPATEAVRTRH